MPKYLYKAVDGSGKTISDVLEAESIEMVNSILLARGYLPTSVNEESGMIGGFGWHSIREKLTPVKTMDLILFTKQFRTMLRSGISIMKLLQVLENQTENINLKKIIISMSQDIREGASLYDTFKKHPKVFSNLYCGMVRAGEASGALPDVLDRLIYIVDHENKVKSDIKAALQYPLFVVVFLLVAFIVLLTFVIPKFVNIFLGAGLKLPLPTVICMVLYQFMAAYWYFIVAGLITTVVVLSFYLKTDHGKYARDAYMMKVPIIGPLYVKSAMSRFASIFSILLASGVSALDSMKILAETVGNQAISQEFKSIIEQLEEGRGISRPLQNSKYFPPIVVNMIAIGEEAGNLEDVLTEISEHYDVEVEYAMKKLTDSIGPLLTIGLAAVVGMFALAIFLPMWDLVGIVQ